MQIRQSLVLATASVAVAQQAQLPSLTEALAANSDSLSALVALINGNAAVSGAIGQLSNITILAPSNSALNALISGADAATAQMLAQPDFIQAVLSYHILNGTYYGSAFTEAAQFLPSILTNESYTTVPGGQVVEGLVDDGKVKLYSGLKAEASVVTANVNFTGGVIHIIDQVLTVPQSIVATAGAANLTSLVGAVTTAGLGDALTGLTNVTVFAPTNEAFAAISSVAANLSTEALANVLKYHVVDGVVGYSSGLSNTTLTALDGTKLNISVIDGEVFVNSAKVVIADVLVANGVVHVIDQVLLPDNADATPSPAPALPAPALPPPAPPPRSPPPPPTCRPVPSAPSPFSAPPLP
ncbi:transforming growth factor-beta-induced protein [Microdochium nivale]|nr:transforming growth factor-beta-induced protein [Microdochium nivale]